MIPKWQSFCAAYPTPAACARRTARRRAAAVAGPRLPAPRPQPASGRGRDRGRPWRGGPSGLEALLALPGIGPYTARGCARVRVRARRGRGRHQHRPRPRPHGRASGSPQPPPSDSPIATCPRARAGSGTRSCMDLGASVCRPPAAVRRSVRWPRRAPGIAPDGRNPTQPSDRRVSARGRRRTRARDRQARGDLLARPDIRSRPGVPGTATTSSAPCSTTASSSSVLARLTLP